MYPQKVKTDTSVDHRVWMPQLLMLTGQFIDWSIRDFFVFSLNRCCVDNFYRVCIIVSQYIGNVFFWTMDTRLEAVRVTHMGSPIHAQLPLTSLEHLKKMIIEAKISISVCCFLTITGKSMSVFQREQGFVRILVYVHISVYSVLNKHTLHLSIRSAQSWAPRHFVPITSAL